MWYYVVLSKSWLIINNIVVVFTTYIHAHMFMCTLGLIRGYSVSI